MNSRYYIAFLIVSFLALQISCNDDDETTSQNNIEDGRLMQITNLYDSQIFPLQDIHINATQNLIDATQAFTETPTETSLAQLKDTWRTTFSLWKELEIYNLGPTQINFTHNRIHRWPINEDDIEAAIASTDPIDANYINSLGSPLKGYGALEYLLFQNESSIIVSQFTTEPEADRRSSYLLALSINLKEQAQVLKDTWISFETEFKTDVSTSVTGSQNRVINALIANVEFIKNTKIEEALNANPSNIELLEAYYSEQSKEAIASNLKSIRATYTGNFGGTNYGIEEYLTQVLQNNALNTEIINAFDQTEAAINAISGSLENALITNPTGIENVRNSFSSLTTLLKTDLASAANIIVTFNDNDGD